MRPQAARTKYLTKIHIYFELFKGRMNALDIILLICLVPAVVQGIAKGFIHQLVSLVSVIAGAWLSFRFSGLVCTWLEPYLEVYPAVLQAIAFFLIMLVVMAVLALVGKAVRSILKFAMLGWLDKLLGMAFALLKAGLAIGIAVILFNTLNTKLELVKPEVLDQSVLYGPVKDIAYAVFPYFKELLVK